MRVWKYLNSQWKYCIIDGSHVYELHKDPKFSQFCYNYPNMNNLLNILNRDNMKELKNIKHIPKILEYHKIFQL